MNLQDLKPNPENPRKITKEKLKQLAEAVKEFGSLDGVIFNRRSKRLVGGHQRRELAPSAKVQIVKTFQPPTKVGTTAVGFVLIAGERFPYREVDWPDGKEKAANIAANKGAGEWDFPQLTKWMGELEKLDFNLDLTMFDLDERGRFKVETVESEKDDHVPEAPSKVRTRRGDVYVLGGHRLLCGDATSLDDLKLVLGAERATLLFTDPPYNQRVVSCGGFKNRPGLKNLRDSGLNDFDPKEFLQTVSALEPATVYFHCNRELLTDYIEWCRAEERGWDLLAITKANPIPTRNQKFLSDIEWIIFSRSSGAYFNNKLDYDWYRKAQVVKTRPSEFGHPTEKWVGLVEQYIQISSRKGDVVLDPFGGSGTTMIACEKLDRKCRMVEIDPKYCDVIVKRWEAFTGEKARLLKANQKP